MKKIKILMAALALGAMTFTTKAAVTNIITFTVVGAVQQPSVSTTNIAAGVTNTTASFTNVVFSTAALLKMIASDQALTLPPGAKLGLIGSQFVVLNKDNSVFADVTVMSASSGPNIGRTVSVQQKKTETSKSQTLQIFTINYSGATLSFSLNILAANTATSGDNYVNGKQTNILAGGYGFGYGTVGGAQMIAKGFLGGGGSGTF